MPARSFAKGFPPPPAPCPQPLHPASGLTLGMMAPTGKGGRRQPPRSSRPSRGRLRCCVPAVSGPPGIRLHFWGAGPRREAGLRGVGIGQPGGAPLGAPAGSSRRGRGRGPRPLRGALQGRAGGGAPDVRGAGGVRVNVRPAPAALTQFHQKPEEEVAEPQRTCTGAEAAAAAAQEAGTGTSAGPAPPHSPAQVTRAPEREAGTERARSMFGPLFGAAACVRVRELLSRPSGRPSGGRLAGACVGGLGARTPPRSPRAGCSPAIPSTYSWLARLPRSVRLIRCVSSPIPSPLSDR